MRARRRFLAVVAAGFLVALAAAAIFRRPLLRATGHLLVIQAPLHAADVIVLTADAGASGILEVADLVHEGIAPRVALFSAPPEPGDSELVRRGAPYEDPTAFAIRQLQALGVASVDRIPTSVNGTEDEGIALSDWCQRQGIRTVVVVGTSDHSRRTSRVLRRSMKGQPVAVTVRAARYSTFDPDRWWETRAGTRIAIVELEKLFLDVLRHPLS